MRKREKIGEILEFPREVVSNIPKITVTAFDEVMIENFKSILEYEDFFVRIKTHIGNINIIPPIPISIAFKCLTSPFLYAFL